MKYAGINWNDTVNGEGICVSFFVQGCPHHCNGCFNPETWAFDGGKELPSHYLNTVIKKLKSNNVIRNFSILGGEPLCAENLDLTITLVNAVRATYPEIIISVWTGYTLEELLLKCDRRIIDILSKIDYLIDGRFEQDKRDITLKWRGSTNQKIYSKKDLQELLYG